MRTKGILAEGHEWPVAVHPLVGESVLGRLVLGRLVLGRSVLGRLVITAAVAGGRRAVHLLVQLVDGGRLAVQRASLPEKNACRG